uniref:Uncharacterized protein n=1 Tax=Tanacetum cinerariifolium TaxID=118510 RepID=A0A6L2M0A9_TANCI|nr:hypothetical protein [Tanacetum cinerariifolium]
MDMIIDQQVAMNEALVPHACRLRIGRSNFCLLSEISFKESTLQLVYDVLRLTPFFKAFLVTADVEHKDTKKSNEMYYPRFTKNVQQFAAMLPIELTNADIRNSDAYKEYCAVATGATPPKTKASVRKTKSSSDTTVTPPPTAIAGLRLSTSAKGDDDDEEGDDGGDDEEGDDAQDDDDQEYEGDDDEDDQEEGSDDEQAFDKEDKEFIHPSLSTHDEEETRDEESFDPIPKTPKNIDDEGNGKENLRTNVGKEEGHDEKDEEDELYRDININLGRGVQMADVHMTQEFEDSHVTLTLVNPDGQQQSSSMSSQFMTSMLNPTPDAGIESIFETTSQMDTLEENLSEFTQTNQFARAVSAISGIVERYMDQRMNEAVKVAVQIQSERLHNEAQAENDEFLKTIDENMQRSSRSKSKSRSRNLYKALVKAYESDKIILDTYGDTVTLKRRRDDDVDKDEEPSARSDWGSKRRREGKEPKSASAPKKKATRSAGKSTQGSKSRQMSASESATAEELRLTTHEMEEPSHPKFETGANDQPIVEPSRHPQWFPQQKKPPTPNQLLVGPTYELMKGSCKSRVELEFFLEEVYKATTNQLDWVNPEGQQYPHNLLKPLPLIPNPRGHRVILFDHFINNDLEYLREGALSRKYTTSVTKTKAADYGQVKWIEDSMPRTMWIQEPAPYSRHRRYVTASGSRKADKSDSRRTLCFQRLSLNVYKKHRSPKACGNLQLGVESYQKKLNLSRPDTYHFDLKRKEAYIAYSNPRGFIYQNKDKHNRLMRIDELNKFSDGTLTDVRTALDDRLKRIQMKYLP